MHLWARSIITLSYYIGVFEGMRWFLIIQIILAVFTIFKQVHYLFRIWYLLWVFLLIHILLNQLWVIKRLSEYVIIYSRAVFVWDQPRLKKIWRSKFLFILILLHKSINMILIDRRGHLELGLSWNNLLNCFFVICRLISHHIETTLHTLTWITFTHSYFPKKLVSILLNILSVPFILLNKHLILRSLIIKIVGNFIITFILIKLAGLVAVNEMTMEFI